MNIATSMEQLQSGLFVVRQGIDRGLAADFVDESMALFATDDPRPLLSYPHDTSAVEDKPLLLWKYEREGIPKADYPAIAAILDIHPDQQPSRPGHAKTLGINQQAPGARNKWHPDHNAYNALIHMSDDGAFDFCPNDDPYGIRTIEVNAGDIVLQMRPIISHRGRNPSDHERIVAVLGDTIAD